MPAMRTSARGRACACCALLVLLLVMVLGAAPAEGFSFSSLTDRLRNQAQKAAEAAKPENGEGWHNMGAKAYEEGADPSLSTVTHEQLAFHAQKVAKMVGEHTSTIRESLQKVREHIAANAAKFEAARGDASSEV